MSTHPNLIVTIDDVPASGVFFDRLISLNITDREGIRADSLELTFNDDKPHFETPRRGAKIKVVLKMGFSVVPVGEFIINRVENQCIPYVIKIRGHSADLRAEMKTHKSRHWDNATVAQIVQDIAADHELETRISDAVSDFVYPWIGQQDETDLAFLDRIAQRHNALFTIKGGNLLWLERGSGKTASNEIIPEAVITYQDIIPATCRFWESDVERYKTVKAFWQDNAAAARKTVVVDGDQDAAGEFVIRDPYSSENEARKAAEAKAREILRGVTKTSSEVLNKPDLMAGQPIVYRNVHPNLDGRQYILETVSISYSKASGLRFPFEARLKV